MILCDLDMVLATSSGSDTLAGQTIHRTFVERPAEFDLILGDAIPFHVVTAKVANEARQVIRAIGLERYVSSVIGADHLFWPTLRGAIWKWQLPRSISKAFWRSALGPTGSTLCTTRRVVMIEDRKSNLLEMLECKSIDIGILVPRIQVEGEVITEWFDLPLALRLARILALGSGDISDVDRRAVQVSRVRGRGIKSVDADQFFSAPAVGGHLIELPAAQRSLQQAQCLTLQFLETGYVLNPSRGDVVSLLRASKRLGRRLFDLSGVRPER